MILEVHGPKKHIDVRNVECSRDINHTGSKNEIEISEGGFKMVAFEKNKREFPFRELTNDELKRYYQSRQRILIGNEYDYEPFNFMVDKYKNFIDCSKHQKTAEAVCEADMFNEISRRFFKIVDMSCDFCELYGIKK